MKQNQRKLYNKRGLLNNKLEDREQLSLKLKQNIARLKLLITSEILQNNTKILYHKLSSFNYITSRNKSCNKKIGESFLEETEIAFVENFINDLFVKNKFSYINQKIYQIKEKLCCDLEEYFRLEIEIKTLDKVVDELKSITEGSTQQFHFKYKRTLEYEELEDLQKRKNIHLRTIWN